MTSVVPIPITVIGGYLGAGKTTVVNAVLAGGSGLRIGVVVNDFGELGIDTALIEAARGVGGDGPPVVNLANGCVCCTLGDDLRASLDLLARVEPRLDHIVIEASGVADPAATAAWGTVPGFVRGGVIVLAAADSVRRSARDRYVGSEVVRQLAAADVLVVTKADRCDPADVDSVVGWLGERWDTPCVVASFGRLAPEIVLGTGPAAGGRELAAMPTPEAPGLERYVRWSSPTPVVDVGRLDDFLDRLPAGILRMKGLLDVRGTSGEVVTAVVQVVGRSSSCTVAPEIAAAAHRSIEAIGIAGVLDVSSLDALAAECLRST